MDDLKNVTRKEVRQLIVSEIADLDRQIEETLVTVQDRDDLLIALHEVVHNPKYAEREEPMVHTDHLAMSRTACAFFRMCLRRRLLLRAQEMMRAGTLDLTKVNKRKLGLL